MYTVNQRVTEKKRHQYFQLSLNFQHMSCRGLKKRKSSSGYTSHIGCAIFSTFFIRFEAKLSEYGSYSHVLVYFDLMQNKYMLKQIFDSERIFASTFLRPVNIFFKIFVLKQIFANHQVNFTWKRIFACKYLHNWRIFAKYFLNYIGKHFTKYSLHFA